MIEAYWTSEDRQVVVYCGDCLEVLPQLEAGSVDAIVTDPPYGTGAYPTDVAVPSIVWRKLRECGRTLAVFGYPEHLVRLAMTLGEIPYEWITWWPTNRWGAHRARGHVAREQEAIAIWGLLGEPERVLRPRSLSSIGRCIAASRGNDPDFVRQGDVWTDACPGMGFCYGLRQHINEKPLSVLGKLVLTCSLPGDVVYDPFMGSGTTGVAAVRLGRRFIGVEIEERYCAIAVKRITDALAQPPLLSPDAGRGEPEARRLGLEE